MRDLDVLRRDHVQLGGDQPAGVEVAGHPAQQAEVGQRRVRRGGVARPEDHHADHPGGLVRSGCPGASGPGCRPGRPRPPPRPAPRSPRRSPPGRGGARCPGWRPAPRSASAASAPPTAGSGLATSTPPSPVRLLMAPARHVAGRAAAVAVADDPDPLADLRHLDPAEADHAGVRIDGVGAFGGGARRVRAALKLSSAKLSTSVQRTQPAASSTSSTTVPGSTGRWLSGYCWSASPVPVPSSSAVAVRAWVAPTALTPTQRTRPIASPSWAVGGRDTRIQATTLAASSASSSGGGESCAAVGGPGDHAAAGAAAPP